MPSEAPERRAARAAQMGAVLPPVDNDPLPCPRCESTNTKFCYYNNYNFSQPRHFCKSCRRYWTHGGTLRDIPIGGGSRKTAKRSRTCSPSSSSATSVGGPIFVSLSSSASTATVAPPTVANSFTSLLSSSGPGILALGGFGFEDVGFGVGRGVWGFPEVGSMSGGVEMDGNRGDTWQLDTGESEFGVSGDCFPSFPGLTISTPGNGLK